MDEWAGWMSGWAWMSGVDEWVGCDTLSAGSHAASNAESAAVGKILAITMVDGIPRDERRNIVPTGDRINRNL